MLVKLLSSLAIFAIALTLGADAPSQSATDFAAEVRTGFDTWDRDKNGQLAKAEVDALISDARVTGKQAAALAAITTYQSGRAGKNLPVTCEFLLREAVAETAKQVHPPFEPRFRDALARIERVSRVLFGPGAPSSNEVRQGHIGDCYFVAVVGAVAERNPDTVKGWIEPQSDKTFRVRFPLGATSSTIMVTDAEIALTAFAGKQGLWINVLEKAFGSIMQAAFPNPGNGDAIESIAFGGSPIQTMRMMTANAAAVLSIRPPDETPPNEVRLKALTPQVRAILSECQKSKRIACAGSPRTGTPPGMNPQHAYAIFGFDEGKETVRLWNPHGNQFDPVGAAGFTNGYPTRHGRFEMPLADFVKVFCFLIYETNESLRR